MNEKKLFASSYFLLFQRTSLVEDRSVLVGSCYSFISIHSEGTTLYHTTPASRLSFFTKSSKVKVSPAYCLIRFTMLSRLMVL